jgi:LacI family transcriptional regulator, galactose operon repressor
MDMVSASIKDVARRAGVSVGTVSNVLNRPQIVAEETRKRILAAMDQLGFVPNGPARQLRAGRGRTVGLVVLDVTNPFFADVARGAEEAADQNEVMITLCNSAEDPDREQRYLRLLEQQRVLGLLISPVLDDEAEIERLARRGLPIVFIDRASSYNRCSVSVDDVLGGRLALEHLIANGHRRLAVITGPLAVRQASDRLAGARAAAQEAGLPADCLDVLEGDHFSSAAGRANASILAKMDTRDRPTGVFCANDLLAIGCLQGFVQYGLSVPNDVCIVGYDDIEFAGAAAVPLTSVRQPREEMGRVAVELLLAEVADSSGHSHREVVFKPELVVRQSSDLLRATDEPSDHAVTP